MLQRSRTQWPKTCADSFGLGLAQLRSKTRARLREGPPVQRSTKDPQSSRSPSSAPGRAATFDHVHMGHTLGERGSPAASTEVSGLAGERAIAPQQSLACVSVRPMSRRCRTTAVWSVRSEPVGDRCRATPRGTPAALFYCGYPRRNPRRVAVRCYVKVGRLLRPVSCVAPQRRNDAMHCRRNFLLALYASLSTSAIRAQPGVRARRVCVLGNDPKLHDLAMPGFVASLRELGWIESRTVTFDYRWAEQRYERFPALMGELVALGCDLIMVTAGTNGALAAKKATDTIPILLVGGADPVKFGLGRVNTNAAHRRSARS